MKKVQIKTLAGIFALALFVTGQIQVYGWSGGSAPQSGQFTVGGRFGGTLGFTGSFTDVENMLRTFFSNPDAIASADPELNFTFALYGNYAITNRISIQTELNFLINQGYELQAPRQERGLDSFDINYSSLDIPLLLRVNFLRYRLFGIMAGPQISIPIGRLEIYDNRTEMYIEKMNIDSSFSLSLTAGLFGGFRAGLGRVVGDMRFIFDFDPIQAEGIEFIRRRALTFSLGYEISF